MSATHSEKITNYDRITIVVITDGQDTASSVYSHQDACFAIEEFCINPKHRIIFLGANQDAILAAKNLGISADNALSVGNTNSNVRNAFRSVSSNVTRVRNNKPEQFTSSERSASGQ